MTADRRSPWREVLSAEERRELPELELDPECIVHSYASVLRSATSKT
ncbi:MAG: hypothetical protein JRG89_08405 [Deltaproteobacteria bacterium]|nr:hypothetical protein [Deltaproteobacteria bacterium]MBW2388445.1 hypothetical protein [Deltaproteobacteria bacterium]MBW2723518.1 hypothetical protein [Deltaproteobacteria bacterium]